MASLWWHSQRRQVSEALSGIGEFKNQAASELQKRGFANVHANNAEVAGSKNNTYVSIGHFPIAGRDYWEVIMGSGDTDATRGTVDEASAALNGMHFL
jgi:hypothetical protein